MSGALSFVLAFLFGVVGTGSARALARRLRFWSRPNPIVAQHRKPIAYLGGLGIAAGICGIALLPAPFGGVWPSVSAGRLHGIPGLLLGSVGFLGLGLADDLKTFSPGPKLTSQFALALSAAFLGLSAPVTGSPALDLAISALYMVTFVNAFNFVDVCDGLLAVIACCFFAYLATEQPLLAPVACGISGATAGFLVFNRPPASIFMGDAGSHLLGFLASALVIAGSEESTAGTSLWSAAIAGAVPLFETAFITVVRVARGLPWWRGSPDHFALRLQAAGLRALEVDLLAGGASVALGTFALAFTKSSWPARCLELAALLAAAAGAAAWLLSLERHPLRRRSNQC